MTIQQQAALFDMLARHEVAARLNDYELLHVEIPLSMVADKLTAFCALDKTSASGQEFLEAAAALFQQAMSYYCKNVGIKHLQLADKLFDKLLLKGKDYANADCLSNFKRSAELLGILPEQSCMSLIATKIARAEQLLSSGATPGNESLEDTLLDLCGYCFLLYCIIVEYI